VQGFGNVGSWAARILKASGCRLLAVEDVTGANANPKGIDADSLSAYVQKTGGVAGCPDASPIDHEEFLSTRADFFIPAAMENQITAETAPRLEVRLVAEGANGPTDPQGDRILQERGIELIPDVLCNAGGVVVSYFEWLQNKRSEFWELHEVDAKLKHIMVNSYQAVQEMARKYETDWRTAAYILAISRIAMVYKERGIFP
jgi:glutamate dehydrogenase (NAD(P)+)